VFIHLRGRREKSIDPQVIRAKNRRFFKGLKHCIVQIRTFRGLTPESPEIRTMDTNKKTEGNKSFLRTETVEDLNIQDLDNDKAVEWARNGGQ